MFIPFSATVTCKTVEEENLSISMSYSYLKICKRIERNKIWTSDVKKKKKTYRVNFHTWPNDRPPLQRIIPFTKRNLQKPLLFSSTRTQTLSQTLPSIMFVNFFKIKNFFSSSQRLVIASELHLRIVNRGIYFVTSEIHERRDQLGYRTPVGIFPFLGTFASISNRFSWPFLSPGRTTGTIPGRCSGDKYKFQPRSNTLIIPVRIGSTAIARETTFWNRDGPIPPSSWIFCPFRILDAAARHRRKSLGQRNRNTGKPLSIVSPC